MRSEMITVCLVWLCSANKSVSHIENKQKRSLQQLTTTIIIMISAILTFVWIITSSHFSDCGYLQSVCFVSPTVQSCNYCYNKLSAARCFPEHLEP